MAEPTPPKPTPIATPVAVSKPTPIGTPVARPTPLGTPVAVAKPTPIATPVAAPAPPSPTVKLKIDGREVEVARGTNLLEACLASGVDVSYFCYHPGLSSPAVCRQCLVEVKGQPKLVPSCYTPVGDNMEVTASSERVRLARQQMLEFTLVNHPVDCPICDKAGECTLQKLYMEWDGRPSRIEHDKVHKAKRVDLGPTIVLDQERCILCTRCIRVCDEVAKAPQLTMAQRGDREILTTAPGQQLDHPYSLNTVDVCPVGALTAKDFRFTMRAWELYSTPSVCTGCATGCNIEIHHAQGRAWRLVPRANPDVNRFWMCDDGRMTYQALAADRIVGARLGDDPAPLDKAVAFAAERLLAARAEPGRIAVVFGAQVANEALFLLSRLARELLLARTYVAGRADDPSRADAILRSRDQNPNRAGALLFAGPGAGTVDDLARALLGDELDLVWAIGEDVVLPDEVLEVLDDHDLIVHASRENDFTAGADVLLPAAMAAESDGTFTNAPTVPGIAGGRTQRFYRALDPPGGARPHWELIQAVARRLGVVDYANLRVLFNDMKAKTPELAMAAWGRPQPLRQLRFADSRG